MKSTLSTQTRTVRGGGGVTEGVERSRRRPRVAPAPTPSVNKIERRRWLHRRHLMALSLLHRPALHCPRPFQQCQRYQRDNTNIYNIRVKYYVADTVTHPSFILGL